jgi:branched-chain amino acid transport system substrate-binding protein
LAAEDFRNAVIGRPIEIVVGDHQNKPDVASLLARRWFDEEHVGAITDMANSSVALAVIHLANASKRFAMVTDASAVEITERMCSPYVSHWTDDTWTLAHTVGSFGVKNLGKRWFFVVLNLVFGESIARETSEIVKGEGGQVVGIVKHPFGTGDMSSFLLQAMSSQADVIALGNVGNDLVTSVKQLSEFGFRQTDKKLVTFFTTIADVDSMGLNNAQGLYAVSNFYWNSNDSTREFAARFSKRAGKMPTKQQAATYVAVRHYLDSIADAKTDAPDAVANVFHARPAEFFGQTARVRADGRVLLDVNMFRVKSPDASKGRWDYYDQIAALPASEAYKEMNSKCAGVEK